MLLAIIALSLPSPSRAMNLDGATHSPDVIDRRLDEKSSPYRVAAVRFSEGIAALAFVQAKLEKATSCKEGDAFRQKLEQVLARIGRRDPLQELPTEIGDVLDPSFDAKLAKSRACSPEFRALDGDVKDSLATMTQAHAAMGNYELQTVRALNDEAYHGEFAGCALEKAQPKSETGFDPSTAYVTLAWEQGTRVYLEAYQHLDQEMAKIEKSLRDRQQKLDAAAKAAGGCPPAAAN
jgi:hypothetical protein